MLILNLISPISFSGITIIIALSNRFFTESAELTNSVGVDLKTIDVRLFSELINVLFNSGSADDNWFLINVYISVIGWKVWVCVSSLFPACLFEIAADKWPLINSILLQNQH